MMIYVLRNDGKWDSAELAFYTNKKDIERLHKEFDLAKIEGLIVDYYITYEK